MVSPQILWISVSPCLKRFDQPLLKHLSRYFSIVQWEYCQTQDEPCSLEIALNLLHDYLQCCSQPIHVVGHGTGGLLALLYARKYPQLVRSLSLLSVGVHPAVDWQAHYYVHRQLLSCSRDAILVQMVPYLFGSQNQFPLCKLWQTLEHDLNHSLSPHTLFKRVSISPGGVTMPLLVCRGEDDIVIDPHQLLGWQDYFKPGDRQWTCPNDSYFFHCFQPELVGNQLIDFWTSLSAPHSASLLNAP